MTRNQETKGQVCAKTTHSDRVHGDEHLINLIKIELDNPLAGSVCFVAPRKEVASPRQSQGGDKHGIKQIHSILPQVGGRGFVTKSPQLANRAARGEFTPMLRGDVHAHTRQIWKNTRRRGEKGK